MIGRRAPHFARPLRRSRVSTSSVPAFEADDGRRARAPGRRRSARRRRPCRATAARRAAAPRRAPGTRRADCMGRAVRRHRIDSLDRIVYHPRMRLDPGVRVAAPRRTAARGRLRRSTSLAADVDERSARGESPERLRAAAGGGEVGGGGDARRGRSSRRRRRCRDPRRRHGGRRRRRHPRQAARRRRRRGACCGGCRAGAHEVLTGVSLRAGRAARSDASKRRRSSSPRSTDEDIAWYVASGEGRDKAGALRHPGPGVALHPADRRVVLERRRAAGGAVVRELLSGCRASEIAVGIRRCELARTRDVGTSPNLASRRVGLF